jgi:DNA-binding MarR family transcriptional regulator
VNFAEQTSWLTVEEQEVWLVFLRAQKLLFEQLDFELRARTGITLDDYDVLARLSVAPDRRLRMSELAEIVVMPKSRLTYRVDQLSKRGYIKRVDSEDDKRGIFAELTDSGIGALELAAPIHVNGVRHHFIDRCDTAHLGAMAACFSKVCESVEKSR